MSSLVIHNVHLAHRKEENARKLCTVVCTDGRVEAIYGDAIVGSLAESTSELLDAEGGLLLPSLCHAHIHLDKCYLLDRCTLANGDFKEALEVTSKAKAKFSEDADDLYVRGRRLVLDSVAAGATTMRAHVEVDMTVQASCLEAGLRIKKDLEDLCNVQISVFAQDPLFSDPSSLIPGVNYTILSTHASNTRISSVGSAPYVEPTTEQAKNNIRLLLDLAQQHSLHADFHLDYNLDISSEPLIWFLLDELQHMIRDGNWKCDKYVCIGHATRLTLFSEEEWQRLASTINDNALPVTFVGLPQSDVYMMGRNASPPPRGTLNVVQIADKYGLDIAMAVNNVQNAFTPQGPPDPLALCPLGVALFHAGTKDDCRTLVNAVTIHAKTAIGQAGAGLVPQIGDLADFVILHDNKDVQSVACNPCYTRTTIKSGCVVARRRGDVKFISV